jgi:ElaB/YqjD/DUF883 family membrane-anchored ribosome-binding protein
MNEEIGRRVEELCREAETLTVRPRSRAQIARVNKTGANKAQEPDPEKSGEDFEETIEDLTDALNQLSGITEERIAQHPIASVAVAFAIGVLIGRLTKAQE